MSDIDITRANRTVHAKALLGVITTAVYAYNRDGNWNTEHPAILIDSLTETLFFGDAEADTQGNDNVAYVALDDATTESFVTSSEDPPTQIMGLFHHIYQNVLEAVAERYAEGF